MNSKKSRDFERFAELGKDHHRSGRLTEAIAQYDSALKVRPHDPDILHLLGVAHFQVGRAKEAIATIRKALSVAKTDEYYFNLGRMLVAQGQVAEGFAAFQHALALNPGSPLIHLHLGAAMTATGAHAEAVKALERSARLDEHSHIGYFLLGSGLQTVGAADRSATTFRKAAALYPAYAEALVALSVHLIEKGELDHATAVCRRGCIAIPTLTEGHLTLAQAYFTTKQFEKAAEACKRALALSPDSSVAHGNLATIIDELGKLGEAITHWRWALVLKPDMPQALYQFITQAKKFCMWNGLAEWEALLLDIVRRGQPGVSPWSLCMQRATPADQLRCARLWGDAQLGAGVPFPPRAADRTRTKIRLGYLSSDLRPHAVAFLMQEVIRRHDRSRLEVIGYSLSPMDGNPFQKRLAGLFDRFVDVSAMPDIRIADQIRQDEVDILVDLNGYTHGARTRVLALRPAPIQVNFLGFAGTMGSGYIDYIFADRFLIPPESEQFYSEKIAFLPSYQPNSTREISPTVFARSAFNLPENGFVFASFNNTYKINAEFFDIWMHLLRRVPGSVLWLKHTSDEVLVNLRREAEMRGVDPDRLVFAVGLARQEDHLARHACADLFLDTLPYNAHTTASDALWAGLPVVTCVGDTFAGRVAGSALTALGVPELITYSLEDYERLAFKLATDPEALAAVRDKVRRLVRTSPLFDIARYTRTLDAAYVAMWENWQAGKPPQHIHIDSAAGDGADVPASVLLERASLLHGQGRIEAAVAAYRRYLLLEPDDGEAIHRCGVALHQAARYHDAVPLLVRSLRIAIGAERVSNYGNTLLELGRVEEALALFRGAIALGPQAAESYSNIGALLLKVDRLDEAAFAFAVAIKLRPDLPVAHFNLGAVLYRQGRVLESAGAFRRALRFNPNFPQAQAALATVESVLGTPKPAVAAPPPASRPADSNPERCSARVVVPMILDLLAPHSVVMAGAAQAAWLPVLRQAGVADCLGILPPQEGAAPDAVHYADLARPFGIGRGFDLAIALEVAGELPESRAAGFVDDLVRLAPVVLFSAAIPWQSGTPHANGQWPTYWEGHFRRNGYRAVDILRDALWSNAEVDARIAQNSLIFVRESELGRYPRLFWAQSEQGGAALDRVHPRCFEETTRALLDRLPSGGGPTRVRKARPGGKGRSGRRILIDTVFFQYYGTGIARVWNELLRHWNEGEFADSLLILNRGQTGPRFSNIESREIPLHSYADIGRERAMLEEICREEDAGLFISTYYTAPTHAPSLMMVYDMTPEVAGWDLGIPMWIEKAACIRHASRFVCISDSTRIDLERLYPETAGRTEVALMGVSSAFRLLSEEERLSFRTRMGLAKPYYLVTGGLTGYKNGLSVIEALARMPNGRDFQIVATGPQAAADSLNVPAGVDLLSVHVDDSTLCGLYNCAVALVFPSRYEGFGMPIIEAQACGCPVVVSDRPVMREVAADTAVYVDPDDADSILRGMQQVLEPTERMRLIATGLDRAAGFTWKRTAQLTQAALERAVRETVEA